MTDARCPLPDFKMFMDWFPRGLALVTLFGLVVLAGGTRAIATAPGAASTVPLPLPVLAGHGTAVTAVTLVEDHRPQMALIAGSVPEPVAELRHYLKAISGADLSVAGSTATNGGIFVGTFADFPLLKLEGLAPLGEEGFLIRSDGTNLFLLAERPAGVSHAVVTFLESLGCRWFFPGKTWEVIPWTNTLAGAWDVQSRPDFAMQRRIWYGFGTYPPCAADFKGWERHNRLGGSIPVTIGHTWHGLDPQNDFAAHPEWFALVGGRRQPTKPCYSHPDVVQRAIRSALAQAAQGTVMISMSPPDGLGYCECERCLAVFQGAPPRAEQGSLFATRPDGVVVNVTSETLFQFVNQVAAAVAERHPGTLVGCYAYSAYSHPPSFKLHPNVFLQTTTAFRRTGFTLEQQLDLLQARAAQVGIRDYYSVYQWDWDYPPAGKLAPAALQAELQFFHRKGVTSVNAEASNNWGARGLGYYLAARLLWDVNADVPGLLRDFYAKAFGLAARPLERHYVRWYGRAAAVTTAPTEALLPPSSNAARRGQSGALDETNHDEEIRFGVEALKESFRDLDEAAALVKDQTEYLARVNHLRLYWHYLVLRTQVDAAEKSGDPQAIRAAVQAETVFGGQLAHGNVIHARPLLGKAFLRRFKKFEALLADAPEAQQEGVGWRRVGTLPAKEELDKLWAEDKQSLGF